MKATMKTKYALRAMIEIGSNEGVLLKDIASRQNIPTRFLDQIIKSLKENQLVQSINGRGSGYRLTRKPKEIPVENIIKTMEPMEFTENEYAEPVNGSVKKFWNGFNDIVHDYINKTTLKDLITA